MSRYRFIVGATLAALEQELNRLADDNPELELRQVLQAQGTGFVAVIEEAPAAASAPAAKTKGSHARNDHRKQDRE